jgi:hypothetical protein
VPLPFSYACEQLWFAFSLPDHFRGWTVGFCYLGFQLYVASFPK